MSQEDQERIIRQQKEEIAKLRDENRRIQENQKAQMAQMDGIKRQMEKDRLAQTSNLKKQEQDRQYENGAVSYLQDKRCATCSFFDSYRTISGKPPKTPTLNATKGFCQANPERIGEISPSTCCGKWEKWAEIDRFEAEYEQQTREYELQAELKRQEAATKKEKETRYNDAIKQHRKRKRKIELLYKAVMVFSVFMFVIVGIVHFGLILSNRPELDSLVMGTLFLLGVAVVLFVGAVILWQKKKKKFDSKMPKKSDFGLE